MPKGAIDRVLKRANEIIISAMNQEVLAGMALGIIQGEKLIYSKGFGLADLEQEKAITTDTVFLITQSSLRGDLIALKGECR